MPRSWSRAGWSRKRLGELGRNVDLAYEMVFAALIGGLVGAKLWYIAENGGPLFSGTGLTFYGGLFGGALAVLAWTKYRGELDLQLCDAVAPSLAAAYAIGRIGCQLVRRRRLRQGLGRAVGDGVSERHRADRHARAPDADLRDADHGRVRAAAVALARPVAARDLLAVYLSARGSSGS